MYLPWNHKYEYTHGYRDVNGIYMPAINQCVYCTKREFVEN